MFWNIHNFHLLLQIVGSFIKANDLFEIKMSKKFTLSRNPFYNTAVLRLTFF